MIYMNTLCLNILAQLDNQKVALELLELAQFLQKGEEVGPFSR